MPTTKNTAGQTTQAPAFIARPSAVNAKWTAGLSDAGLEDALDALRYELRQREGR